MIDIEKMLLLLIATEMEYRYFLKLSYNGAAYKGWQQQPNAITVQQILENGLSAIYGGVIPLTGCGRTDAGVHSTVFYAHLNLAEALDKLKREKIVFRLNRFLPPDIHVSGLIPVIPEAHARFSALWREYEYVIIRKKDPFRYNQAYFVHGDLDVERMNECSSLLIGKHNFESFSKVNTQVNNFYCDIHKAIWEENEHILRFTIRADRFLRNMVRAIVGTILDVGKGKISVDEFQAIIATRSRSAAGYSVPAKGLTLTSVGYPDELFCEHPIGYLPESCNKIISHYYTDSEFHNSSGHKANE